MIPNRFHFVFGLRKQTKPFHVAHYLCLESCRQVNHPEAIRFYYHYEPFGPYWDLIKPHLSLVKVDLHPMVASYRYSDFNLEPYRYAHHSDFIRMEKLLEEGGIYADIDTLFIRPLPPALFEKPFVMGRERDVVNPNTSLPEPSLCNALMMSEKDSEFGRLWIERMSEAFDGTWSNHSTLLPRRLAEEAPHLVHIEPESSFFHFPPTPRGLAALFEENQDVPAEVYSIHLWEHLWWSRRRKDVSMFHEGLITEHAIWRQETTFNKTARAFLPLRPISPQSGGGEWLSDAADHIDDLAADARALAGVALIPLIRKAAPGFGRIHLARARLAYRKARRRFQPRNSHEAIILRMVVEWDEYRVFGEPLAPEDVVIDIGAHIGSFTFACHWAGSRNIHAFEPLAENFASLESHTAGLDGVTLYRRAVFSSDRTVDTLTHSGPNPTHTGAGNVLFGGRIFDPAAGRLAEQASSSAAAVAVEPLDRILDRFERVALLKVDCEGSEYPILLTSRQLGKVSRIVGEYHVIPQRQMEMLTADAGVAGAESYSAETLAAGLRDAGFAVTFSPVGPGLGYFEALRRP